jgi:2-dehydro-3-deoxyphosphogluconate aldolase / (4S)-4-hydroxy-2-oxoglutarate aldolase
MPQRLIQPLTTARVVGVLRAASSDDAVQAALAATRGGLRALELTFTTPNCTAALEQLADALPRDVLLGAGSVMNARQAREAIRAGAKFLVSPHLGEDVLREARKHNLPYVPGVLTPTEIARALELGAAVLKLFPIGSSGGAAYLNDLRGPFPELVAMVTGGVQPSEVGQYVKAGALAVGLGSNLFPKAPFERGDWLEVERATRLSLEAAGVLEVTP